MREITYDAGADKVVVTDVSEDGDRTTITKISKANYVGDLAANVQRHKDNVVSMNGQKQAEADAFTASQADWDARIAAEQKLADDAQVELDAITITVGM